MLKVNNKSKKRSGVFEYIWHVSSAFLTEFEDVNARWNTLLPSTKFIGNSELDLGALPYLRRSSL